MLEIRAARGVVRPGAGGAGHRPRRGERRGRRADRPNGAGKTSTLRAISGLVPYRGTVTFDGARLPEANTRGARTARADPRSRGPARVPVARRAREPAARDARRQPGDRRGSPSTTCTTCSRRCRPSAHATAGRSRVVSSRWSRSAARSWPGRGCCCSTSRRWGCRRNSSPVRLPRPRAGGGPDPHAPGRAEHRDGARATARELR